MIVILTCIGIPVYFFWRWIFRKYIHDVTKRKIATWALTVLLTMAIYAGLIASFLFYITREPGRRFDRLEWSANKNRRFEMGDDIVRSQILIGKDTAQVKQILGQPTWRNSLTLYWTYDMGEGGGGLGFLFHNLSVSFEKDKVIKVEHGRIKD